MKEDRPVIGITMGDAAGIGPEIIMKALSDPAFYRMCRPSVLADAKTWERAGRIRRRAVEVPALRQLEGAEFRHGVVDCLDLDLPPDDLPFGEVSAEAVDPASRYLEKAVQLARKGKV